MSDLRVGIYAGTFDPVHAGHVAFALQALQAAKLDKVYFLPERRPRAKQGVEHFGHRVAMISRALKPHPQFEVLELVDVSFSVERTMPHLRKQFDGDELVFLFGSDIIKSLVDWPKAKSLIENHELVIGIRSLDNNAEMKQIISSWPYQPKGVTIFPSYAADVSSGKVRDALRGGKTASGILKSVERYSDHNWLYVSLK